MASSVVAARIQNQRHLLTYFCTWRLHVIWRCFGEIFRLPSIYFSIGQVLKIWFPSAGSLSQFDLCRAGVGAFGLPGVL